MLKFPSTKGALLTIMDDLKWGKQFLEMFEPYQAPKMEDWEDIKSIAHELHNQELNETLSSKAWKDVSCSFVGLDGIIPIFESVDGEYAIICAQCKPDSASGYLIEDTGWDERINGHSNYFILTKDRSCGEAKSELDLYFTILCHTVLEYKTVMETYKKTHPGVKVCLWFYSFIGLNYFQTWGVPLGDDILYTDVEPFNVHLTGYFVEKLLELEFDVIMVHDGCLKGTKFVGLSTRDVFERMYNLEWNWQVCPDDVRQEFLDKGFILS